MLTVVAKGRAFPKNINELCSLPPDAEHLRHSGHRIPAATRVERHSGRDPGDINPVLHIGCSL